MSGTTLPITAPTSGSLAMAEVVRLLGVQARWVIFGHTHCAGPLPWMDRSEWALPGGGMLLNTGCWTDEPRINSTEVRSPYRPGRGVLLDGDADPEPLMLVGHLPHLARLASLLLVGDPTREILRFRPGAIARLERAEHGWVLGWMLTPDIADPA